MANIYVVIKCRFMSISIWRPCHFQTDFIRILLWTFSTLRPHQFLRNDDLNFFSLQHIMIFMFKFCVLTVVLTFFFLKNQLLLIIFMFLCWTVIPSNTLNIITDILVELFRIHTVKKSLSTITHMLFSVNLLWAL